jgi:hypothetical protein
MSFRILLMGLCLAGCEAAPAPATEAFWAQRQTLYRLDPHGAAIDVYGLRGGIAALGRVALPAGFHGERLVLDVEGARLTVSGPEGSLAVDARALRLLSSPGALAAGARSDSGAAN